MSEQEYISKHDIEQQPPVDIGTIIGQSFDEDDILSHAQALRLEVIKMARSKMNDVPAYASLALQAADGLDKQIINKRKIGAMSALLEENELVRNVVREIVNQTPAHLFKRKSDVNVNEIHNDDGKLPPAPNVEGIRDIGISNLTYESFMEEKGISATDDSE